MNHKSMTIAAVVLGALGLGLGLFWWFIGWWMGAFAALAGAGHVAFILGLGVLQLLGWAVVLVLILRSTRRDLRPPDLIVVGISAGVFFGNLVWYLTPILGAPLIVLMVILGLVSLYTSRKQPSKI